MANSKRRCKDCKNYFPYEEMVINRLGAFCAECGQKPKRAKPKARVRGSKPKPRKGADSELRKRVRRRDRNVCRFCGAAGWLEVHHVLYRSELGPDHASNLITLCDEHHTLAHSNKGYWQPVLLAVIWCHYMEDRFYTVPQMERELERRDMLPAKTKMIA